MKWQPIHTAPKDGTMFFGLGIDFKGNYFYSACKYDISQNKFVDSIGYSVGDILSQWIPILPLEDEQETQQLIDDGENES